MFKSIFSKENFSSIFIGVIIGLTVAVGSHYILKEKPIPPTLKYETNYNSNIINFDNFNDELEIIYKGQKIENLTKFDFTFNNVTPNTIEDIVLYFKVTEEDRKPIFYDVSLPEGVAEKVVNLVSEKDGQYVYKIDFLNGTEGQYPENLRFSFFFIDETRHAYPAMTVKTSTPGLKLETEYYEHRSFLDNDIFIYIFVMSVIFSGCFFAFFVFSCLYDGYKFLNNRFLKNKKTNL